MEGILTKQSSLSGPPTTTFRSKALYRGAVNSRQANPGVLLPLGSHPTYTSGSVAVSLLQGRAWSPRMGSCWVEKHQWPDTRFKEQDGDLFSPRY